MNVLKLGMISLLIMGALITGMSLFIPSQSRVSRAITIPFPIHTVNEQLSDLRTWTHWNVLLQGEQQTSFSTSEEQIVGKDIVIERKMKNDSTIVSNWRSKDSRTVECTFSLTRYDETSTIVQWYFDFQVKWYPWEKFGSILFDRQLGPQMEKSLDQFKKSMAATHE